MTRYEELEKRSQLSIIVTDEMHSPITHSFSVYQNSSITVSLHAGQNEVKIFAVSDHGVSRVDTMTLKKL